MFQVRVAVPDNVSHIKIWFGLSPLDQAKEITPGQISETRFKVIVDFNFYSRRQVKIKPEPQPIEQVNILAAGL